MHMQRRPSAAAGALAVLLGHIHPVRCAADSLKLELGAIGHTVTSHVLTHPGSTIPSLRGEGWY